MKVAIRIMMMIAVEEAFPKHSDLNYDGGDHSEETKRIATKKSCDDIRGKKM